MVVSCATREASLEARLCADALPSEGEENSMVDQLDEFALYRQLETASKTSEASVKRPDRLIKDMDLILRLATKSDGNIVKTSILRLLFEKLYSLKSET